MFPAVLKQAGYYTAAAGKWHMGNYAKSAFDKVVGGGPGGEERWVQCLEQRPKDRPFFMWFASFDAHRGWSPDKAARPHAPEDAVIPPYLIDTSAVREAFPHIRLQVDANSAYSLETSDALKPLDDLDLLLIEQPLFEDDIWDHRVLQSQFKTPICLDESVISPRHARYALEMQACKIINIKPGRVGGLSQGLEIHAMCRAQGVPVWCGGMLETGVGRASNLAIASLPGFTLPGDISASDRYFTRDITHERFSLSPDSTIKVPDAPGLGVTIDEGALELFTLARLELKAD